MIQMRHASSGSQGNLGTGRRTGKDLKPTFQAMSNLTKVGISCVTIRFLQT